MQSVDIFNTRIRWDFMGYRLRAALVVGFLLVSLSTWADITKLDCSFPRVSSSRHGPEEQEFKFTILIDDATETAIVVGRSRETAHLHYRHGRSYHRFRDHDVRNGASHGNTPKRKRYPQPSYNR